MRSTRTPASTERVLIHPNGRRSTLIQLLALARSRIRLSLYRLDDHRIVRAIGEARQRGVEVDVLATSRVKGERASLDLSLAALAAAGAGVHRYPDRSAKYHAKYLLVDDQLALVTSLNLTRKCLRDTCDFAIVTEDPGVVDGLGELFDADLSGRPARAAELSSRLIVGPGGARARLARLLEGARRSIVIIDHKLNDTAMIDLLDCRARDGVRVTVIDREALRPLKPHGRLLVIDDRLAVVGSFALTAASLDRRRELAIVVDDESAVLQLSDFVARLAAVPGDAGLPPLQAREVIS